MSQQSNTGKGASKIAPPASRQNEIRRATKGGRNRRRSSKRHEIPAGRTLFDGIHADRREVAAANARQRRDESIAKARLLGTVANLPMDSVEQRAANLWFVILGETDPAQGVFRQVTDLAFSRIGADTMSSLDKKRVQFGFNAARKAMKEILFGDSSKKAAVPA